MEIPLRSTDVTIDELQQAMDQAWSGRDDDVVRQAMADEGVGAELDGQSPFNASPGGEGFGAVELILIAAAGRLAASIPERLLVRLFDEVIWPKLQARFGSSLERPKDGD